MFRLCFWVLDYCNVLCMGLPLRIIRKLQLLCSAAVRLPLDTDHREQTSSPRKELPWLLLCLYFPTCKATIFLVGSSQWTGFRALNIGWPKLIGLVKLVWLVGFLFLFFNKILLLLFFYWLLGFLILVSYIQVVFTSFHFSDQFCCSSNTATGGVPPLVYCGVILSRCCFIFNMDTILLWFSYKISFGHVYMM